MNNIWLVFHLMNQNNLLRLSRHRRKPKGPIDKWFFWLIVILLSIALTILVYMFKDFCEN